MKVNVPLPFDWASETGDMLTMDAVRAVGEAMERAGFHAALVTDHPAPTGRWLDSGGHKAHDSFVTLAMIAAVTTKVRLQTGIIVLPYRNPFIIARAVATLDRFSNGRVALSVGAGYLKGEYKALGVPFDQRNELMDEYMKALRVSLTGEEFTFEGTGYTALGNRIVPGPVQKPVPLYVGGNSRKAMRRAVELGDGWNPYFTAPGQTTTTRTAAIETPEDLAGAIAYLRQYSEETGRAEMPEVVLGSVTAPGEKLSDQHTIDRIEHFRSLAVSTVGFFVNGSSTAEWCDNAEKIGADIIAKLD